MYPETDIWRFRGEMKKNYSKCIKPIEKKIQCVPKSLVDQLILAATADRARIMGHPVGKHWIGDLHDKRRKIHFTI